MHRRDLLSSLAITALSAEAQEPGAAPSLYISSKTTGSPAGIHLARLLQDKAGGARLEFRGGACHRQTQARGGAEGSAINRCVRLTARVNAPVRGYRQGARPGPRNVRILLATRDKIPYQPPLTAPISAAAQWHLKMRNPAQKEQRIDGIQGR